MLRKCCCVNVWLISRLLTSFSCVMSKSLLPLDKGNLGLFDPRQQRRPHVPHVLIRQRCFFHQTFQQPLVHQDAADFFSRAAQQQALLQAVGVQVRTDQGHVQRASAEVHDQVHLVVLDPRAIAQDAGGRFVQNRHSAGELPADRLPQPVDVVVIGFHGHGGHDVLIAAAQRPACEKEDLAQQLRGRFLRVDQPSVGPTVTRVPPQQIHLQPTKRRIMVHQAGPST